MSEFHFLVMVLFSAMFSFYSIPSNFRKLFQLSYKTWSHFLFAQHREADLMYGLWWTCLRYDNFFPQWWKLKNKTLQLIVITFCRKRPSSVIVWLNGFLAIWAHQHAGKHTVSVNNCCLQISNSSVVFRVRFRNLPGYFLFNSLSYNLGTS